mgnify:CR=1 FL=1
MRRWPTLPQWFLTLALSATGVAVLRSPDALPGPLETGVRAAVDSAAYLFLRAWGEPTSDLTRPNAPWSARPHS